MRLKQYAVEVEQQPFQTMVPTVILAAAVTLYVQPMLAVKPVQLAAVAVAVLLRDLLKGLEVGRLVQLIYQLATRPAPLKQAVVVPNHEEGQDDNNHNSRERRYLCATPSILAHLEYAFKRFFGPSYATMEAVEG
jgi:hypothetical protein